MKQNNVKLILAFGIAAIIFIAACSKNGDLPTEPVKISLNTTQTTLVSSGNSFAFDLFRAVVNKAGTSDNLMISPLSVSYALCMTLNGAKGATYDSMLKALRLNGISPEDINSSYKKLTDALTGVDTRVKMSIANSVWVKDDFPVKKPFADVLTDYYDAEARQFDINDPTVPSKINSWISDKTNGLINNMVDRLEDNTVMLLINAIYFKGKWKSEFEKDKTVASTFYKPVGTSEVPMMKQKSDFGFYDGDGFMLGEFPYGQGNFVMDIILPDATDGIGAILPNLTRSAFDSWTANLTTHEVNLAIPKFKYTYREKMKEILSGMEMGIAFTDNADLTGIADASLLINDVTHQTFIETNEEGTEAAAATVVGIGVTSVGPSQYNFIADHPFIYVIRETTTNSILFMGVVADPSVN